LGTTRRSFDAENGRARVLVDGNTDTGTVGSTSVRIAIVNRIDAFKAVGTRDTGDPAAHPSRFRDLRRDAAPRNQGDGSSSQSPEHATPRPRMSQSFRPAIKAFGFQLSPLPRRFKQISILPSP
jgi:hypothetical protein